ncbi:MAG TPA: phage holin family protein [Acidimicrobiia bacterium]|nr:phage holin family protein [Acidimicrobiia bacterium]
MSPVATTHGSAHDARPPQMARYRTLPDARHAIEELEAHGVDGNDIALVGEAALVAEHEPARVERDARFLEHAVLWVVVSALLGALGGVVLGAALVGIVVLAWPDGISHPLWAFGFVTGFFMAAGAVLGGFVGVARGTGFSESWETTFAQADGGPVWLAVYRDDDRSHHALEETHPLELRTDARVETSHPDEASARS